MSPENPGKSWAFLRSPGHLFIKYFESTTKHYLHVNDIILQISAFLQLHLYNTDT